MLQDSPKVQHEPQIEAPVDSQHICSRSPYHTGRVQQFPGASSARLGRADSHISIQRAQSVRDTYLLPIPAVLTLCCAPDRKPHPHLPGEIAFHPAIHPVGDQEERLDEHECARKPADDDVDGPSAYGRGVEDALDVHCFVFWERVRELPDEAVAYGGYGEPGAGEDEET